MAKRGFFPALRVAGSVFGFIRIRGVGLIGHRFVQDRLRDGVALGCPVAQVEQAAALAAEGKIGMGVEISGFLADGAVPFHVRPPRELHAPVCVEAVIPARNLGSEDPGYNAAATNALPRATAYQVKPGRAVARRRSEEHTSELQSQSNLVCRLLLEKKKKQNTDDKSNYT